MMGNDSDGALVSYAELQKTQGANSSPNKPIKSGTVKIDVQIK